MKDNIKIELTGKELEFIVKSLSSLSSTFSTMRENADSSEDKRRYTKKLHYVNELIVKLASKLY